MSSSLSVSPRFKVRAHFSTTSARCLISTCCQHFRFDHVKIRRKRSFGLPYLFSFFPQFSLYLISLPWQNWLISLHLSLPKHSPCSKCWTLQCSSILLKTLIPAWMTSLHAAVQGNTRKDFSSPQTIGSQLCSSTTCDLWPWLLTLTFDP